MDRAWRALMDATFLADTRFGEVLLALALIWRGVWLVAPGLYASPAYEIIREIAPLWAWAGAFMAVGWARLIAIASQRLCWRRRSTLFAVALWLAWSIAILSTTPGSIGAPYALLAFFEVLVWQRLAAVKRLAHREML